MTTLIPERLDQLDTLHLDKGSHRSFEEGMCLLEAVAWVAGETHSDRPKCASPVIAAFRVKRVAYFLGSL